MSAAFDLDYQYCKIHLRVRHFQAQPQDSNFKTKFKGGGQECPPHTVSVCPPAPTHLYFFFRFQRDLDHQEQRFFMPKRTFQPNRRHRSKTHGFLTRMKTKAGRAVISRRRAKGRKRVSVKPGFRE